MKSGIKIHWLCFFIALCGGVTLGFGQQYQVEGEVSITHFGSNGKPGEDQTSYQFSMSVSNRAWRMMLKPTKETIAFYRKLESKTGQPFDIPDFHTINFDGTELYLFADIESSVRKLDAQRRSRGEAIPENNNSGSGYVLAQEVPHFCEGDSQVWLTYGSSFYFKSRTTNRIEATWPWGLIAGPLRPGISVTRNARWELQQKEPFLPQTVCYLFETNGFTNAVFQVNGYTNFAELVLPTESVLTVYMGPGSAAPQSRYVTKARVFKKLQDELSFPPPVPVLTSVLDYRHGNPADRNAMSPFPYFVKDRFLSREEASNAPSYKVFQQHRPAFLPEPKMIPNRTKKWIMLSIFGLSGGLLLLMIFNSNGAKQQ